MKVAPMPFGYRHVCRTWWCFSKGNDFNLLWILQHRYEGTV